MLYIFEDYLINKTVKIKKAQVQITINVDE